MSKTRAQHSQSELDGKELSDELTKYIKSNNGHYLRDSDDSLHVILNDKRIPIDRKRDNRSLNRLMFDACGVTTLTYAARTAIRLLEIHADKEASRLLLRKFSAISQDGKRLYIPLADGSLLSVTKYNFLIDKNGENEDGLWVEHPNGNPFGWSAENPSVGIDHFERLLVKTQACKESAMQWFVAMHEGLFPFVRDLCPARLLFIHLGDSQTGKTTGAQRFTLLHGLGSVKGDFTIAALNNIGDIGLLAMDNKEQCDLTQDYINFLLFLSTGAERGRSQKDGRMRTTELGRPVGVITSIEGIAVKEELRKRCIEVHYAVTGNKLNRGSIEREILEHRDAINSAIVDVLTCFFVMHLEGSKPTPNPIPDFEEHFTVLCNLLRAYGVTANKPWEWAEDIIDRWNILLADREPEESILEHPLLRVLGDAANNSDFESFAITCGGKSGTLKVAECGTVLTKIQALNLSDRIAIPDTPVGLGKRLRSTQFRAFKVLDQDSAPDLVQLKRTSKRRPIGFFFEDDSNDD